MDRNFFSKIGSVLTFILYIYFWLVTLLYELNPDLIVNICFGFFIIHTFSSHSIESFTKSLTLSCFILSIIVGLSAFIKKVNSISSEIIPEAQFVSLVSLLSIFVTYIILLRLLKNFAYFGDLSVYFVTYSSILPLMVISTLSDGNGWRQLLGATMFIIIPSFVRDFIRTKSLEFFKRHKQLAYQRNTQIGFLLTLVIIGGYIIYLVLNPVHAMGRFGPQYEAAKIFLNESGKFYVGYQIFDTIHTEIKQQASGIVKPSIPPAVPVPAKSPVIAAVPLDGTGRGLRITSSSSVQTTAGWRHHLESLEWRKKLVSTHIPPTVEADPTIGRSIPKK